jgi:hypothetical protein
MWKKTDLSRTNGEKEESETLKEGNSDLENETVFGHSGVTDRRSESERK